MRNKLLFPQNWQFTGPDGTTAEVTLPHTWNAKDGQDGGNDYWRGSCTYRTDFAKPGFDPAAQQVWLQFEGVNASAEVILNGKTVATHDGGYSTFRAEVTQALQADNELTVKVDNSKNDWVYPQKADFTFYGVTAQSSTVYTVQTQSEIMKASDEKPGLLRSPMNLTGRTT